jgi:hypothetical protein
VLEVLPEWRHLSSALGKTRNSLIDWRKMKARLAIIIAASLGLLHAGAPALAQDAGQESSSTIRIPPPAPAPADAVGNPQLRNFSLSGTVTRPSDASAPVEPATRPSPPRQQTAQRAEPPREQSAPSRPTSESRDAAPAALPAPTQATRAAEPWPGLEQAAPPTPAAAPAPRWDPPAAAAAAIADSPSGGIFPWLLAALLFGGAAAWFFLRQRPRQSYAGAGAIDRFEAPPAPAPPRPAAASTIPRPSAPPRAPEAPKPGANSGLVVSTRLRPWLEIEFVPIRGMVDEQKAAVAFKVSVFNSGSVPARDILVEACLINGGQQQDQEIQQFFANPVAKGNRLPIIPPLKRVEVESGVALQREMLRPIEIEGRTLFVPMVAFNVLYSWSSGQGQTSASYLVGKQTKGEKLAPFRLDLGPRIFRDLAEREHQLRLRK